MILSGLEIQKKMGKEIIIDPFDPRKVNPNSYNLTLHNELLVYDNEELDMKRENTAHRIRIPEEGLLLQPGKLYLGRTAEYTRRGVCAHAGRPFFGGTAGAFHPCDSRIRGCGICRLLDFGDLLRPTFADLSQCGDLPDLLPHPGGGLCPLWRGEIPEQPGYSAQFALPGF